MGLEGDATNPSSDTHAEDSKENVQTGVQPNRNSGTRSPYNNRDDNKQSRSSVTLVQGYHYIGEKEAIGVIRIR